ncbi:hypothetical protein ACFV5N_11820 [Streptomyces sp. NPDC059853]|uniref:hypothetical protein n=1 Tax=Streptomyces sp. NPDC059853 TaxID=3346973 RepID=UPI00364AC825
MSDEEGQGTVHHLPLVRLFGGGDPPPDAAPPPDLRPPDGGDGYPDLEVPDATPPAHLSMPDVPVGADDQEHAAVSPSGPAGPDGGQLRATAGAAMVVAAGIAVAALRGAWQVGSSIKARAEHWRAARREAAKGRDGRDGKDGTSTGHRSGGLDRRVPFGPEWGRGAKGGGRGGSRSGGGLGGGTFGGGRGSGLGGGGRGKHDSPGRHGGGRGGGLAGHGADSGPRGGGRGGGGRHGGGGGRSGHREGPGGKHGRDRPDRAPDRPDRHHGGGRTGGRKNGGGKGGGDRRHQELERRLERRRRHPDAPVLDKDRQQQKQQKPGKKDAPQKGPKVELGKDGNKTQSQNQKKGGKKRSSRREHSPGGRPGSRPWEHRKGPKSRKERSEKPRGERLRDRSRTEPPPRDTPSPDGEWLRPPPGWTVNYEVRVDRADGRRSRAAGAPAGITTGARALPRAPEHGSPRPTGSSAPPRSTAGGTTVTAPVPMRAAAGVGTTQYTDSDLTLGDVIDADADMAEEILAGADQARDVAERCEEMTRRLEDLHARIVQLSIPGVLERLVVRLMEQADVVRDRAEAVAATLPRASEAIATAGANAEARHGQLVRATADHGHVAPAERDYHKE